MTDDPTPDLDLQRTVRHGYSAIRAPLLERVMESQRRGGASGG